MNIVVFIIRINILCLIVLNNTIIKLFLTYNLYFTVIVQWKALKKGAISLDKLLYEIWEKLEDAQGVITSHKSKKVRQYNGQKKNDNKRTNKDV